MNQGSGHPSSSSEKTVAARSYLGKRSNSMASRWSIAPGTVRQGSSLMTISTPSGPRQRRPPQSCAWLGYGNARKVATRSTTQWSPRSNASTTRWIETRSSAQRPADTSRTSSILTYAPSATPCSAGHRDRLATVRPDGGPITVHATPHDLADLSSRVIELESAPEYFDRRRTRLVQTTSCRSRRVVRS